MRQGDKVEVTEKKSVFFGKVGDIVKSRRSDVWVQIGSHVVPFKRRELKQAK